MDPRSLFRQAARSDEVDVYPSRQALNYVADRIEQAYRRRNPRWSGAGVSERLWTVAAEGLCLLHRLDRSLPIDPELFVASQKVNSSCPDPWAELTPSTAFRRYRRNVRNSVRRLRAELERELLRAERDLVAGRTLESVLESLETSLSPIGCFVLAHRADREDLIERYRADAELQHKACPLYREACLPLLPEGLYPEAFEDEVSLDIAELAAGYAPAFSLN